ncbi:MAG: hypothetical protein Q9162_004100 [Coniocarpon cinnabarinum]
MTFDLPPLPSYHAEPLAPLVAGIPDKYLTLILPIVAYWAFSMLFHVIDVYDLFPQYRLHTPVEITNRNHVSRWEVFQDVIIQQVIQTIMGVFFTMFDPDQQTGMDDYNIAVWGQRIRMTQRFIPSALALVGLDSTRIAQSVSSTSPALSTVLSGGHSGPTFASWELSFASALYNYGIPVAQFAVAIFMVDTWQYFLHRLMHTNKYLYTTFHSRHHRLYVPYAYGALYNHPFEGFLLDTCGAGLAYLATGMTVRQSMLFFTGSTCKTVDDHCGYALPFDPLQRITGNNAGYHDVHHQSWGIKTNFSQPFFTFWDRMLGTKWTGGDVSARYERQRLAAEKKEANRLNTATKMGPITDSLPSESTAPQNPGPYTTNNTTALQTSAILPQAPNGKATAQALDSRRQVVYEAGSAGGPAVLTEETAEELRERENLREQEAREANCLPGVMRTSTDPGNMMKAVREVHRRRGSLLGAGSTSPT